MLKRLKAVGYDRGRVGGSESYFVLYFILLWVGLFYWKALERKLPAWTSLERSHHSQDLVGLGLSFKGSHLLGVNLSCHWPEKQQREFELSLMSHVALLFCVIICLGWRLMDFFFKCAFGVTGEAIQNVHSVIRGDETIRPFSSGTKLPTPRK